MPTVYAALEDRVLAAHGSGGSWRTVVRLTDREPECVATSPDRPEQVFVGTFNAGVWRSSDGGWQFDRAWLTDAPGTVTAITVSPHDPDVVWAGTEPSKVYRSNDGGQTWQLRSGLSGLPSADEWSFPPRPDTHHARWLAVDPTDPTRLYVAVEAGALVLTTDGGDHWRDRPGDAPLDVHAIATHPDAPGRLYAAAGDGYAESTDGGEHWQHLEAGLDHGYLWGVAVDPTDPDHVLVSAAASAGQAHDADGTNYVYRYVGDRWELTMDGLPGPEGMTRADLDTGPDGAFYALTNHGIYRSPTGDGWHRLPVDWQDSYRQHVPRGLAVV